MARLAVVTRIGGRRGLVKSVGSAMSAVLLAAGALLWAGRVEPELDVIVEGMKHNGALAGSVELSYKICNYIDGPALAVMDDARRDLDDRLQAIYQQPLKEGQAASNWDELLSDRLSPMFARVARPRALLFLSGSKARIDKVFPGGVLTTSYDGRRTLIYSQPNNSADIYPERRGPIFPPGLTRFNIDPSHLLHGIADKPDWEVLLVDDVLHGEPVKLIQIAGPILTEKLWVDPAKGFVTRRLTVCDAAGRILRQTDANFIVQANEGIWFPTHVAHTRYQYTEGARVHLISTYLIDSMRFNSVNDTAFEVDLPKGTKVRDHHFSPSLSHTIE